MFHHLVVSSQNNERIESGCNQPSKTEGQTTRTTEGMRACEAVQEGNNQQNPDMPSMEHAFLMR